MVGDTVLEHACTSYERELLADLTLDKDKV